MEFNTTTYFGMYAFITTLPEDHFNKLNKQFFMVLDEQSVKDRKCTLINRYLEWLDPEGNVDEDLDDRDDLKEVIAWKRHRITFEKVVDFWAILEVKPGLEGEAFLEDVTWEDV